MLGSLAAAGPAAPRPLLAARSIYVVQPDPRLCPSPLCGGYWVSRANQARTRCHDGLLRSRCYVAVVASEATGEPLGTGLPPTALARASIGSRPFDGVGDLGVLFVTEAWGPGGPRKATGDFFRLVDTGVRCIRAPCFSLRVSRLNRPYRITVSDVDLRPALLRAKALEQAEAALATPEGLLAAGAISPTASGGRVFRASQVFLRLALPRA